MESHYTYYSEYSIKSWISFLLNGEIKRPPYQRKFVWNLQKAYNLVKAVIDGNFVPPVVIAATQHDLGKKQDNTFEIPKGIYLVDGQQRLTSLLLFYLGIWPKKGDEDPPKESEDNDENEELADSIDTPLDDLTGMYTSMTPCSYHELVDKTLGSPRYIRLGDIKTNKDVITTNLKSEIIALLDQINGDKEILLSRCLGYSYVRSIGDDETEKKLFANLFRDINSSGQKLLPAESRQAMYYLEPSLKGLFDPDFLTPFTIGKSNKISIDLPRYLAYVDEMYSAFVSNNGISIPSTSFIAYGYSSRQDDYVVSYLTQAVNEKKRESESYLRNMPQFEASFKSLFPHPNMSFENVARFELWIYGLIFWVLFQGKEIDTTQKSVLEEKFSKYQFNPNQRIGGIRERLKLSVDSYQKVLKNA